MMGNQKLFFTYKAYNGGNVIFGSNLRGNIIGKCTIFNDSLKIDNVEHVDNLGFNLLSIGKICDNKCRVTSSEYDSKITKDGKVIGRGIRKKGLYVRKLRNKPKDQICITTIDENSTLWHKRLGHANMHLIQSLSFKELVRNLPKLKFDQHFYNACKMGKQAHASHKAKNVVSTTRCLELLHMDLFGPSAIWSYGGNRYTLVIVDDYSRPTHLGLWYPKGTGIKNVVYADSDHARDYVDRKSTSGSCTFVGFCMTSWFSKKQSALAISTTEAKYEIMPHKSSEDYKNTRHYIPKISHEFRSPMKEKLRNLEERYIHEGRVVFDNFTDLNYVRSLFHFVEFECLLEINEQVCPRFILKFYSQYHLSYSDEGQMFVKFFIQNQYFSFTLEDFAQILRIHCEGACVFSDRWSLDELVFGTPSEGPYQTILPSPNDIISYVREDREGQVTHILHQEEVEVQDYQILTREIVSTLKPLEQIIWEDFFYLGGNQDHVPACLCYMLYYVANSERFNFAYFMAKRMEWVTKQARLILTYEQKVRKDHGTRRGHPSTSSSDFDQPSSSHLNDDDNDGNNEETSRASTPSLIRYVNSLTNQVPQVFQNPPNIKPHLEPFYTRQTKIINRQVQLRDEQHGGVRLKKIHSKGLTSDTNGMIKVLPPKTTEEVVARERERKARITLLMALPEDHLAKFHKMADAKEMWEAIKSKFGLHKGYDRFQTLLSQLKIHGAGVSHKDANQKFLRSLPSSWSQVALIMRTKPRLDTLSFFYLYNNLRVFEHDVKGTTASSSSNTQNVAFMSADNTSSTNDINDDDMEEMDLKWQVAMISIRIKKFHKRLGRKLQLDIKDPVGFDKTKVECFNCHKIGHFARDCRAKGNQDSKRRDVGYNRNKARESGRRPAYHDDSYLKSIMGTCKILTFSS
uniref:Retrotransposon protein n=1 Tax=Tanacetum cinerariifolium TaxID=118510 RepID=A0A699H9Y8_TANCI|nr:retrotransposon protein [Tanacetum cinerariifolium]